MEEHHIQIFPLYFVQIEEFGWELEVEIIEPHGLCAGVNAAVAKALSLHDVYCLHELVHNETVVGELKSKGMRFVESLDEVPDGGTVLFSAHGVGPAVRRAADERGLAVIDATCPFVARVHRQVREYAARALPVVVVGHAQHVEVAGVVDEALEAGARVAVVAAPEDVAALPFPLGEEVGAVCQTTLSGDVVRKVMEALRARHPGLVTSATAEVLQVLFMMGTGDIDDLIMNTVGACVLFVLLHTGVGKNIVDFVRK